MRQHDADLDAAEAEDDGYDLLAALNENRIRAGWLPILPADEAAK